MNKAAILLELWKCARYLPHIYSMAERPAPTLPICTRDIAQMRANGSMKITTYYGKRLSVDLSGDVFDPTSYEEGVHHACDIIHMLQKQAVINCIITYFKGR